ncbi:short-chain dehydrogenase [Bacillaceae bacterium S4-13-56]
MKTKGSHALVIGGTGMLKDVSLWLNKKGYHVTVVGRQKSKFHRMLDQAYKKENFSAVNMDYHETEKFIERLKKAQNDLGSFEVIVSWVHSTADELIPKIFQMMQENDGEYDFYHLNGSRAYIEPFTVTPPSNCNYHEIILGFKLTETHSRWLTNKEISDGVIDSIQHHRQLTIVGQMEPWELRPN